MSTDDLITALQPYGLTLRWSMSGDVYQVVLEDWNFLHTEAQDHRAALQQAYDQLQEEKAAE